MFYPNYFTTFLKLANEMKPDFSSSKSMNTFFISALLSLFEILAVIKSKNSPNSISSVPYSTRSLIIWKIGWLLASPPKDVNEAFNSGFDYKITFGMYDSSSLGIKQIEGLFDLLYFIEGNTRSFELLQLEGSFAHFWSSWVSDIGCWISASSHRTEWIYNKWNLTKI